MIGKLQYELRNNKWWDAWNNEYLVGEDMFTSQEFLLIDRLNFCGCVNFQPIIEALTKYLNNLEPKDWGIMSFDSSKLDEILIACIADVAGFTEHGGNIVGSWLTDEGKAWLAIS